MSDGTQWKDTLSLAFKRLRPKAGEIIVVNFPPDVAHEQMDVVAQELKEQLQEGVTVLCLREGMTVELLSEEDMNSIGWYKMGTIQ